MLVMVDSYFRALLALFLGGTNRIFGLARIHFVLIRRAIWRAIESGTGTGVPHQPEASLTGVGNADMGRAQRQGPGMTYRVQTSLLLRFQLCRR